MILNKHNLDELNKNGFFVIKNLLDEKDIEKYQNIFLKKKKIKAQIDNFELSEEECWNYLINKNLTKHLKFFLGEKIFYLHDLNFVEHQIENQDSSWHRDNPCRSTGLGPDWNSEKPYNVLTTITYMSDSEATSSVLNVIPGSHLNSYKYTFSNILRFLLLKIKKQSKFLSLIIKKFNGKRIKYKVGDCIVFYSNLYHMGELLNSQNIKTRKLIVSRFGGSGVHSENYVNYHLKHRKDQEGKYQNIDNQGKFIKFLKTNNIYIQIPQKKIDIKGAYSTL
tara:strand:+ start:82 stop:918 length:837 start_codon:yes stop_codon:yes gene_type:complete